MADSLVAAVSSATHDLVEQLFVEQDSVFSRFPGLTGCIIQEQIWKAYVEGHLVVGFRGLALIS